MSLKLNFPRGHLIKLLILVVGIPTGWAQSLQTEPQAITPETLSEEYTTTKLQLSETCQSEAVATVNAPSLALLREATEARAAALRKYEQDARISILAPELALRRKISSETLGRSRREVERLRTERSPLNEVVRRARNDEYDARMVVALSKTRAAKDKTPERVLEDKVALSLRAAERLRGVETQLKVLDRELAGWNQKATDYSRRPERLPTRGEIATFVARKKKELKVLAPLSHSFDQLAGVAKSCDRLARQKSLREDCIAASSGRSFDACGNVFSENERAELVGAGFAAERARGSLSSPSASGSKSSSGL